MAPTTELVSFSSLHVRYESEETATATDQQDEDNSSLMVFSAVFSNILLFFLIFGLSATVDVKNLKRQLTNKFAIGCGVAMQFIIMPLLGFASVKAFDKAGLTEAMGIALLVVTSSPGGSFSNWWCSMFNAELALSVAMTAVSSILSIGLLPANLLLYTFLAYGVTQDDRESVVDALDFGRLFITLGIVLGAIVLGMAAGYRWDNRRFHVICNRFGSACGLLLIVFSIFLSSGADGAEATLWNQPWAFYVAILFPCLLGMSLANIISRSVKLSPPETVAISIECCYQNTGIATSVAVTMFEDAEDRAQAVAVPLFYGIVEAIVIGVYCVWAWKAGWTKAPRDENICIVLAKTYEIDENEESEDDSPEDSDDENEERSEVENFEDEIEMEYGNGTSIPVESEELPEAEEVALVTHCEENEPQSFRPVTWMRGFVHPVLVRISPPFFSMATDKNDDVRSDVSGGNCDQLDNKRTENEDSLEKPRKPVHLQRSRFNTADTSLCSGMSSSLGGPDLPSLSTISSESETTETPTLILSQSAEIDVASGIEQTLSNATVPKISPGGRK